MTEAVTISVLALVAVGVLWAMLAAWRRRDTAWAARVPPPAAVPGTGLGAPLAGPVEATYVSTTAGADRLTRVVAHDLGVRSAAEVSVHPQGVVVRRTGARDLLVPAGALTGVGTAAGMAGKHVGGQGLVVVGWRLGDEAVATGLRTRHRADRDVLVDAVDELVRRAREGRPDEPARRIQTEEQA